ncbi:diguanylate phosphodiesterase [Variovorax paradoxus]|uniref:putative bifunctional diguanylate cyclase/phosphodiesterase n=1 Tax=Variovorax TaxID=34072 RepID=UPI0006E4C1A3|nr:MULTISPECIES: EAL domain-containing protein [unclassified Variovorax]KPU97967.1 diguanylate phosphodiesterase [Variovorax paradoxus]KPV12140.1 diguanylate phosphodiesterase [Variovorax paradoxus]KPV14145.1 diguanylate phosphodiesterase [Variovorax paradoxus]KPV18281.1 diguanylate phosphodiesterase [Variovorax paradoxus]KPV27974.1 diguanylate phosphodiesterase [Variovorax paradoxus]
MNPPSLFLPSHHDPLIVAASLLIATLASFVALDLSRRMRGSAGDFRPLWWSVGSVVLGTGIWSMHFVGMLGFTLPIELGFSGWYTFLSWVAAVAASGVALWVASRPNYSLGRLGVASLVMGGGICGMHYIGMAALQMAPGILWQPVIVALSALVGVGASAAALLIMRNLGRVSTARRPAVQLLAALVMGIAICGMHYTGMAAANFAPDSVCLSANELHGAGLTVIVVLASCVLLLGTLLGSILEGRMQVVTQRLANSLENANAELTQANRELQRYAFTDALTGLPNRVLFEDRLQHALARMARVNQPLVKERVAILFVDLDGFKPINDSFGHAAGDEILRAAARRLGEVAGDGDTVARIGGDEFLLLLEGVSDAAEAAQVANRALRRLAEPFSLQDKPLQIACSIGIVVYPGQGEPDKLVANADAAMYIAKRAGGANYVMFESHMGSDVAAQLRLQSDLRRAVDLNQFELHYQPKMDGRDGSLSGVEALVRWNHPELGLIGPAQFIGLAERFGMIVRLGDWILDEACRQIALWRAQGLSMPVAVNLSVMQLREVDFVERVERALTRHAVPASLLLCEITESVAMEDIRATHRTFEGLAAVGVFLSIDDFGTGYSSLSQLRRLPARQVKIDRSFVQDLESKEDSRAVVDAVIRLAHALGLSVVAEGVENEIQRDILLTMGCDELQGFLYSRALPASQLFDWLAVRAAA